MPAARASLILAIVFAVSPGEAEARQRGEPNTVLRARTTTGVEVLEAGPAGPHQSARRSVTDLLVRLKPWVESGRPMPTAPIETARSSRDKGLFAAELIIAAGGRIHIEERSVCGPWLGDIAICRTECDGGAFALVRRRGGIAAGYTMQLGKVAAVADAGFGDVVRLGACSDEAIAGGLVARTGSPTAEIDLEPR